MDRQTDTDGHREKHRWTERDKYRWPERETGTDRQTEINRPDVRKSGRHIPPDDSNDV